MSDSRLDHGAPLLHKTSHPNDRSQHSSSSSSTLCLWRVLVPRERRHRATCRDRRLSSLWTCTSESLNYPVRSVNNLSFYSLTHPVLSRISIHERLYCRHLEVHLKWFLHHTHILWFIWYILVLFCLFKWIKQFFLFYFKCITFVWLVYCTVSEYAGYGE